LNNKKLDITPIDPLANEKYRGFHQWDFSINDDDFLIGLKK
jgi:hypothetical protein